uniref:Uncharacterized protein n=1 Tax=Arundo donax TaxID=35708 RepID=A0A0A9FG91_ARUDO
MVEKTKIQVNNNNLVCKRVNTRLYNGKVKYRLNDQ